MTLTLHVITTTKSTFAGVVYAIALGWPKDETLILGDVALTADSRVELLGYNGEAALPASQEGGVLKITFPSMSKFLSACPGGKYCMSAYTLKLVNAVPVNTTNRDADRVNIIAN